jgi:hypothetical protein
MNQRTANHGGVRLRRTLFADEGGASAASISGWSGVPGVMLAPLASLRSIWLARRSLAPPHRLSSFVNRHSPSA